MVLIKRASALQDVSETIVAKLAKLCSPTKEEFKENNNYRDNIVSIGKAIEQKIISGEYKNKTPQFFKNFDLVDVPSGPGTSVYTEMSNKKVKSVDEWRKKRRNRRKAILENIKTQKPV